VSSNGADSSSVSSGASSDISSSYAVADPEGVWRATLLPQAPSSDEHTITASAQTGATASIHRVVFGDVWVCSGQSNMDHPMTSIINATNEIAAANSLGRSVRLFKVQHTASTDPATELIELPGLETQWSVASNVTVSNFSATCWLTGSMHGAWFRD
jgi:sialate O-acetylesterase